MLKKSTPLKIVSNERILGWLPWSLVLTCSKLDNLRERRVRLLPHGNDPLFRRQRARWPEVLKRLFGDILSHLPPWLLFRIGGWYQYFYNNFNVWQWRYWLLMWIEENLTTTPLPVEKRRKAHEVTTNGIVKAGNLKHQGLPSFKI